MYIIECQGILCALIDTYSWHFLRNMRRRDEYQMNDNAFLT